MKIIYGQLPKEAAWRVVILVDPAHEISITWYLALALARAYNGQIVAAAILPDDDPAQLKQATETLQTLRETRENNQHIYPVVITEPNYGRGASELADMTDADLLLTQADGSEWHNLDQISCTVAALRGHQYSEIDHVDVGRGPNPIARILVPTVGGPNTAHALGLFLPLAPKIDVTALYVARANMGENEKALGQSRLQQALKFIDARDRIAPLVVTAESAIDGIIDTAANDYDLVVIGATQESSFDRALFGDIPAAVVRESQRPVLVTRQPKRAGAAISRDLSWFIRNKLPQLSVAERSEAYVNVRRSARPTLDYFTMMALSTIIASLGLLLDSPAVVIGAMLVAPLMSPIVATGMAIVLGDPRFLRLAVGAVARGATLAVFVSFIVGLARMSVPLTGEILARTEPNLLDLAVALFSGVAGAYALCRRDVSASLPGVAIAAALVPPLSSVGISLAAGHPQQALGALLLFMTNFVAMSSASILTFLLLGFRPTAAKKSRQNVQIVSMRLVVVLLAGVALLLAFTTYRVTEQSRVNNQIEALVNAGIADWGATDIEGLTIGPLNEPTLRITLTLKASQTINSEDVARFREFLAQELERDVHLRVRIVPTIYIDPEASLPDERQMTNDQPVGRSSFVVRHQKENYVYNLAI
jgi:uncharacterized hydrophobic protein (TIGR00271 family)